MPQKIAGIDIGSYSIKIAQIERSFRAFEFVGFYERHLQYNELLTPEESASIALQGLIDDHHLSWDVAFCGYPGQRVSSRLLTFPFGSPKKIEQTVQFEIESQIPFDPENLIVDYAIVWSTKEASRVLAAYIQKGEFVKFLTMLQNANVEPRAISAEGVELMNLVTLGMVPPEAPYAIIDIGHEKTTVAICQGRHVGHVRAISIAGKALTEAIAKRLQVPMEEAERMKIEMGHLSLDPEEADDLTREVVEAVTHVVEQLLLQLRQTFFNYRDAEDLSIEGVYLSGGTSRLPGIDTFFSDRLKQNVTFLNCSDFHFTRLERADAHRHVVPQALALALEGVTPSGGHNRINFRKGEFAFKGDVEQLGGSMRSVGFAAAAIVLLALTYFSVSYYSLKGKLDQIEVNVQEVVRQALPDAPSRVTRTTKGALSMLKSKEAELLERKKQLQELMGLSPLDVLNEISGKVPNRKELSLNVEKINISSARVVLSGSTESFEGVDRIRQSLEKSSLFRSVTTGNVHKGVKGEIKFDLSIEMATDEEV